MRCNRSCSLPTSLLSHPRVYNCKGGDEVSFVPSRWCAFSPAPATTASCAHLSFSNLFLCTTILLYSWYFISDSCHNVTAPSRFVCAWCNASLSDGVGVDRPRPVVAIPRTGNFGGTYCSSNAASTGKYLLQLLATASHGRAILTIQCRELCPMSVATLGNVFIMFYNCF